MPTLEYLALFTGRPENSFGAFAEEALIQATLLFSIVTQREEYPDTEDGERLAINAILEMADRIYLEQPHTAIKATPFASETIGSYSYSKSATVTKAQQGQPTGLFWWEIAVDELTLVEKSLAASGSVSAFDRDNVVTDTDDARYVVGPADGLGYSGPYDINAELNPRPSIP